jgi:hypothetical protein
MAPLVGGALGVPFAALGGILSSLVLGTISLSLIGAVGAGLTLASRRGGVLLSLLTLPLALPRNPTAPLRLNPTMVERSGTSPLAPELRKPASILPLVEPTSAAMIHALLGFGVSLWARAAAMPQPV